MGDNLIDPTGNADLNTPNSSNGGDLSGQVPPQGDIKRERGLEEEEEDDEDRKPGRERRKIEIKFIQDKSRRHITFSKRKAGIMKKAYELSVLTGTQVLLLVVSETGLVYTFTTPKLQPLVTKPEGKNLIQACLNAPEESVSNGDQQQQQQQQPPQQPPQQRMQQQQPSPVNDLMGQGPPMDDPHMQAQANQMRAAAAAAAAAQQQQMPYMSPEQAAYSQYLGLNAAPPQPRYMPPQHQHLQNHPGQSQ